MRTNKYVTLTKEELLSLQQKGIEILSYVIKAIKQMGLTYYCVGGTAIGAIKYQGFVPWDDDIDIAMPRDDYMKFLLEGKKYLPNHLFISSCFTEKQYFGSVAKVRDINTSYFDVETARFNICHGVFVDIFPIDGFEPLSKKDAFRKKLCLGKICFAQRRSCTFLGFFKSLVCSLLLFFKSLNKCCSDVENILSKNHISECEKVYNRIMVFDKAIFGRPINGRFADLDICLPERIDEYLKICYGDIWMEVPTDKQFPHHFAYLIDLNTPYIYYKYSHRRIVKKC